MGKTPRQWRYRHWEMDLIGQRFGRWLVLDVAEPRKNHKYYKCRCECGTEREQPSSNLLTGGSKSCGCINKERWANKTTRPPHYGNHSHGEASHADATKEYNAWGSMKQRCNNPSVPGYLHYGGRGISVCQRWLDSYENFLADMGRAPSPKHSIDRIDNDGNYEPGNCRWATAQEQAANKRATRLTADQVAEAIARHRASRCEGSRRYAYAVTHKTTHSECRFCGRPDVKLTRAGHYTVHAKKGAS